MIVIVTGSRIWWNREVLGRALLAHQPSLVVTGACPHGADCIAEQWAKREEVDYRGMPARWNRTPDGRYDKGAGFKRNQRMLEAYPGELVLAFPAGEARGTRDCIGRALKLGHPLRIYNGDGTSTFSGPGGALPQQSLEIPGIPAGEETWPSWVCQSCGASGRHEPWCKTHTVGDIVEGPKR